MKRDAGKFLAGQPSNECSRLLEEITYKKDVGALAYWETRDISWILPALTGGWMHHKASWRPIALSEFAVFPKVESLPLTVLYIETHQVFHSRKVIFGDLKPILFGEVERICCFADIKVLESAILLAMFLKCCGKQYWPFVGAARCIHNLHRN